LNQLFNYETDKTIGDYMRSRQKLEKEIFKTEMTILKAYVYPDTNKMAF
jgi:hypothetical protein